MPSLYELNAGDVNELTAAEFNDLTWQPENTTVETEIVNWTATGAAMAFQMIGADGIELLPRTSYGVVEFQAGWYELNVFRHPEWCGRKGWDDGIADPQWTGFL